ncbi:MAG TPA: VWA domain-containing protein [Thermoanaerobaculia bacterium]|nr:VWA domain-containing protein [Thermoanaerobaculia bacterium]
MKNIVAVGLIATLLVSPIVFAQEAPVFGETLEIRVTNVEVIVSDKSGKPVHGLTKDDFEIYENGVRQELTNFAEIGESVPAGNLTTAPGQATAEPVNRDFRRRLISVFIDNASLNTGNRASVLPQLRQFLASNVRPGDGIAIYSWGSSLNVQLEPTSDPAAIAAAVDKLASHTTLATSWRQEFRSDLDLMIAAYKDRVPPEQPPISDAISTAGAYASRATTEMRQKTAALKSVIASLRGIEGRKVLVMLTESLSTNPAEDTFQYIETIKQEFANGLNFNPFAEARPFALQGMAKEISDAANGAGVTLYPIHAAGKWADSNMMDASESIEMRAGPSAGTIASSTQTLFAVAEDTGGKAMAGSSNFKLAFDTISNDLNVYYSLGYRTEGARQDRLKNVEVKLKKKGYTVRTRKAIVEQTAATEMNDMVAANLFQTRATNDLNIKAGIGAATPAGENLVHPLTITIPTSTLTLMPDGADLVGKFSIFAAFLRSDGAVSSVGRQTQQFRFPAASLAKRKEVTVKLDVTADARVGAISLGVMDEASSATGFALVKLPTPAEKTGSTE